MSGTAAAGAPDSLFLPSKSHLSICPHLVPACPELSFAPVSIVRLMLMLTGTPSGFFLDSMWFHSALPSQPGLGVSAAPSGPGLSCFQLLASLLMLAARDGGEPVLQDRMDPGSQLS